MEYIIRKTCQMLKWNKRIFLLLLVEILLGMSVVTYSLNLHYSVLAEKEKLHSRKRDLSLEISSGEAGNVATGALTLEDYRNIQEISREKGFLYIEIPWFYADPENNFEFSVLLVDYGKMGLREENAYWGTDLENIMTLDLLPIANLQHQKTPEKLNGEVWETGEDTIDLKDCVILPLKCMEKLQEEIMPAGIHMEWDSEELDEKNKIIQEVENYLNNAHGEYFSYRIYSPEIELENNGRDVKQTIQIINKAGVLFLLMFFVSMASIYRLLFEHREKTYGISLACGASCGQIMKEIFSEICLLNGVGTFAGTVLGFFATYYLDFGVVTGNTKVQGDWRTILTVFGISLLITLTVSRNVYRKLKKRKIISLLNGC